MSIRSAKQALAASGKLTTSYNKALVEADRKDTSHDDGFLHPSAVGGCPTASALAILQVGQVIPTGSDSKGCRIFAMGHAVHDMLQSQFVRFGFVETIAGSPAIELPISIQALKLRGSMDALIKPEFTKFGKRAILEAKSINSNALKKLSAPKPEHLIQGACYYRGAVEEGFIDPDENEVIILYYGKDDSAIKEFNHQVNKKNLEEIEKRSEKIWDMVSACRDRQQFPVPYYENPNIPPCTYCQWKNLCHDSLQRVDLIKDYFDAQGTKKAKPSSKVKSKGVPARKRRRPPVRR